MASYKPVTAALRVLEVLAAVNRLRGVGTVGDIHQQTGIDKATVVRMLETLISAGYILRADDTRTYAVTGKTLMLSASFNRHKVFGDILSPLLDDFRDEIGWPSDVALFDHDAMLVIETSRRSGPLSFNRAPGYRAPVLGASLGLAYIAHCPEDERAAFLASIDETQINDDNAPWNAIARDRVGLDRRLEEIRSCGYATIDPDYARAEYSSRISSIGVPIMQEDRVFAAINVVFMSSVLAPQAAVEVILPGLQRIAARMAEALAARMARVHG